MLAMFTFNDQSLLRKYHNTVIPPNDYSQYLYLINLSSQKDKYITNFTSLHIACKLFSYQHLNFHSFHKLPNACHI